VPSFCDKLISTYPSGHSRCLLSQILRLLDQLVFKRGDLLEAAAGFHDHHSRDEDGPATLNLQDVQLFLTGSRLGSLAALPIFANRIVDLGAATPILIRERYHRIVDFGRDRQIAIERFFSPLPPQIKSVGHHSRSAVK
jgi:hypothetical protein